jgi:hypothetical protein
VPGLLCDWDPCWERGLRSDLSPEPRVVREPPGGGSGRQRLEAAADIFRDGRGGVDGAQEDIHKRALETRQDDHVVSRHLKTEMYDVSARSNSLQARKAL